MDWLLVPLTSLGPLHFGMTVGQVATILGAPSRRRKLPSGQFRDSRGVDAPIITYGDGGVVEIEIYPEAGNVIYNGQNLFSADPAVLRSSLIAQDGAVYEGAGVLVFMILGLSTTLFHQTDTPSITAFAKGTWDHALQRLRPVQ